MNVTLKKIDPVNAIITIGVVREDYENDVKKGLKKIQETVNIPGFRPGKVPTSRIRKMYGKTVLVDEINRLVSEELYDYIRDNKLRILGEPLPTLTEQQPLDFDNQENYEFAFDVALTPEMNVTLTKEDKIPYYTIEVSDEMLDKQINGYRANFGTYAKTEEAQERDMIKGDLIELDKDGNPEKYSIDVENAVLMPSYMKSEEERKRFIGAKPGTAIVFNPYVAYDGNVVELSSFLDIEKPMVDDYKDVNFRFEIKEVTRYQEAELNQEFFDKIFEPGTVTSEEEFRAKVKETMSKQFIPESDYRFLVDIRTQLIEKAKDIIFPDAFLKRWLLVSGEERTKESIEEDYSKILEDLKFHLIKDKLITDSHITIEEEDIKQCAKQVAKAQFAQYGMPNVSDDVLGDYMAEMLKREDTFRNLRDRVLEEKLTVLLKDVVTLEPTLISLDDYQEKFEPQNN